MKSLKYSLILYSFMYTFFPYNIWVITYRKLAIFFICIYTISCYNSTCCIKICFAVIFIFFIFNSVPNHTYSKLFSIFRSYQYMSSGNNGYASKNIFILFKYLRRSIHINCCKIFVFFWDRCKMQKFCFLTSICIDTTSTYSHILNEPMT